MLKNCKTVMLAITFSILGMASASAYDCVEDIDQHVTFRHNGDFVLAERIIDYVAVIAKRDLFNSSGQRLSNYKAIIRQDRANIHNLQTADIFGTSIEQIEEFFETADKRQILSSAEYFFSCHMSQKSAKAFQDATVSGEFLGTFWVILFRHPNGGIGIFTELVG